MSSTRRSRTPVLAGLLATCALGLSSCGSTPEQQPRSISIPLIGDAGYLYDYIERKDVEPPLDAAGFVAKERAKWTEDKRPLADFQPPPMHTLPSGAVVAATGIYAVAEAVRAECAQPPGCDFGVLLGDNIYPNGATMGQDGHSDAERFDKIFAQPYGKVFGTRSDARLYAVLGNHDWRTSREAAQAQVDYLSKTAPFHMDGFFYRVVPPGLEGEVEIFALDTEMLLSDQTVYEEKLADDGSELPHGPVEKSKPWSGASTDAERAMLQWFEQSIAASKARWKIVIGHHPLWSSAGGKFEQARVLRQLLLPTLCRYADLYLAGHDHTLELHTDDCRDTGAPASYGPLVQVVSGAASKQRGLNSLFQTQQVKKYPQLQTIWSRGMIWGYAHLTLTGDRGRVRFLTATSDGKHRQEFEQDFARRTPREQ